MNVESNKNISISSGDVVVDEDKPVLVNEDKGHHHDELQEIITFLNQVQLVYNVWY